MAKLKYFIYMQLEMPPLLIMKIKRYVILSISMQNKKEKKQKKKLQPYSLERYQLEQKEMKSSLKLILRLSRTA